MFDMIPLLMVLLSLAQEGLTQETPAPGVTTGHSQGERYNPQRCPPSYKATLKICEKVYEHYFNATTGNYLVRKVGGSSVYTDSATGNVYTQSTLFGMSFCLMAPDDEVLKGWRSCIPQNLTRGVQKMHAEHGELLTTFAATDLNPALIHLPVRQSGTPFNGFLRYNLDCILKEIEHIDRTLYKSSDVVIDSPDIASNMAAFDTSDCERASF